jgi:hypothetical protein
MRWDMAKVVHEEPRRGSRNKCQKFGGRLTSDEVADARDVLYWREQDGEHDGDWGPAGFIPWSRYRNWDHREFGDNIGPLRKYLRKQVGRRWDDIWSEVTDVLDQRDIRDKHVLLHIRLEVERRCWMGVSGTVYTQRRYSSLYGAVTGLYVHPFTGVLCWAPERRYSGGEYKRRAAFMAALKGFGVFGDDPYEPLILTRGVMTGNRKLRPTDLHDYRIEGDRLWMRRKGIWFIQTRDRRWQASKKALKAAKALLAGPPY